ncbi:hypothetical protein FOA52_005135 [Chlamydomonas sp. UWO 241]|nr:hypothetical protein FOA52_005135 [Chlamydomonas sp. UWO 241]
MSQLKKMTREEVVAYVRRGDSRARAPEAKAAAKLRGYSYTNFDKGAYLSANGALLSVEAALPGLGQDKHNFVRAKLAAAVVGAEGAAEGAPNGGSGSDSGDGSGSGSESDGDGAGPAIPARVRTRSGNADLGAQPPARKRGPAASAGDMAGGHSLALGAQQGSRAPQLPLDKAPSRAAPALAPAAAMAPAAAIAQGPKMRGRPPKLRGRPPKLGPAGQELHAPMPSKPAPQLPPAPPPQPPHQQPIQPPQRQQQQQQQQQQQKQQQQQTQQQQTQQQQQQASQPLPMVPPPPLPPQQQAQQQPLAAPPPLPPHQPLMQAQQMQPAQHQLPIPAPQPHLYQSLPLALPAQQAQQARQARQAQQAQPHVAPPPLPVHQPLTRAPQAQQAQQQLPAAGQAVGPPRDFRARSAALAYLCELKVALDEGALPLDLYQEQSAQAMSEMRTQ